MSATTTNPATFVRPEHLPWCDPDECYVSVEDVNDIDQENDSSSHYGRAVQLEIDSTDAMPWRNQSVGREIEVRPIEFIGHVGVQIDMGDTRRQSTSGSVGVSWLTPAEARALAALLVEAAQTAEATA